MIAAASSGVSFMKYCKTGISTCLTELTPKGVPVEASVMLYKYYVANQEEGRDYVVLANQNFNAYFGTTAFSQKWTAALAGKVIEKKYSEGVSKYRIMDI